MAENDAVFVAAGEMQAGELLQMVIEHPEKCNMHFENAQHLVAQNHQAEKYAAKIFEILNTVSVRS